MDEELRTLEQRCRTSPDDVEAAVRYGLALARAGERGPAARVLAGAVDRAPGSESALRALDSVAPGGLDPESPWPGNRGHPTGAERSAVRGPDRLRVLRRGVLSHELDLRYELAIDSSGRLLATNPRGEEPAPVRGRGLSVDLEGAAGDFLDPGAVPADRLVHVDLEGRVALAPGKIAGGAPMLLAGWTMLAAGSSPLDGSMRGIHDDGRVVSLDPKGRWCIALGHLIAYRAQEASIEAIPLAAASARWRVGSLGVFHGMPRVAGGDVWVHSDESLLRIDLATGERRSSVPLEPTRWKGGDMLLASTGVVFLARASGVIALSGPEKLWSSERSIELAGLAGPGEELLLGEDRETSELVALDTASGEVRWRIAGELQGEVRVDRPGRVYFRRGQSLVAVDFASGHEIASLEIGGGWSDFAFAGEGLIALLRRVGITRTELVVIGQ